MGGSLPHMVACLRLERGKKVRLNGLPREGWRTCPKERSELCCGDGQTRLAKLGAHYCFCWFDDGVVL